QVLERAVAVVHLLRELPALADAHADDRELAFSPRVGLVVRRGLDGGDVGLRLVAGQQVGAVQLRRGAPLALERDAGLALFVALAARAADRAAEADLERHRVLQ